MEKNKILLFNRIRTRTRVGLDFVTILNRILELNWTLDLDFRLGLWNWTLDSDLDLDCDNCKN